MWFGVWALSWESRRTGVAVVFFLLVVIVRSIPLSRRLSLSDSLPIPSMHRSFRIPRFPNTLPILHQRRRQATNLPLLNRLDTLLQFPIVDVGAFPFWCLC